MLSTIGIGIDKGVPVEADPPLQTEYLQVLTKLRARAEALRWLCQSGRILDVVNGCAKYPVLIKKAGAHFWGSADSLGGRTVGGGGVHENQEPLAIIINWAEARGYGSLWSGPPQKMLSRFATYC